MALYTRLKLNIRTQVFSKSKRAQKVQEVLALYSLIKEKLRGYSQTLQLLMSLRQPKGCKHNAALVQCTHMSVHFVYKYTAVWWRYLMYFEVKPIYCAHRHAENTISSVLQKSCRLTLSTAINIFNKPLLRKVIMCPSKRCVPSVPPKLHGKADLFFSSSFSSAKFLIPMGE